MSTSKSVTCRENEELFSPFIAALLIVLFLFFIDEGYYDFRWMREWGNWFVFGIYLLIFFPVQWIIAHYLLRSVKRWKKVAVMVLISLPLTLAFLWLVF
jgi:hypothetical protein